MFYNQGESETTIAHTNALIRLKSEKYAEEVGIRGIANNTATVSITLSD